MQDTGGAEGNRTPDLYNAIVALYQLSYNPEVIKDCNITINKSRFF